MARETSQRLLVLARHGQSEGNRLNQFTGWQDLPLTLDGEEEARISGRVLLDRSISFRTAFTSKLRRASKSCELMMAITGEQNAPIFANEALNERDYGDLTGLNKNDARERFGETQIFEWRRSYESAPPNGESLRDTVARVAPFFVAYVFPAMMQWGATLIVAHGNSLRALILLLENIAPKDIESVELGTGELRVYEIGDNAHVLSREIIIPKNAVVSGP